MIRKSMLLLHLLLCIWLAGCTLQTATPPATGSGGTPDAALQKRLAAITQWQFNGKLAVRTPEQSESAQIQWQQDTTHFDIRLSGPAGLKATRIHGKTGDVHFEQGNRREHAGSAEALSQQLIGWPLPANSLASWLRGMPAAHSAVTSASYTPEGWLAYLEQDDWTIHFSQHRAVGNVVLPGRIEAVHGDVRILLVIKEWQAL